MFFFVSSFVENNMNAVFAPSTSGKCVGICGIGLKTDGLRLISDLLFWVPGPPISLGSLRIEGGMAVLFFSPMIVIGASWSFPVGGF